MMLTAVDTLAAEPRPSGNVLVMDKEERFVPPEPSELQRLESLDKVLKEFEKLDPSMPLSYLRALLAVAMKPGQSPQFYARKINRIQPVVSRILLELGPKWRYGDEGHKLLDSEMSLEDRRSRRNFLTPRGKGLIARVVKALS